MINKSVVGICAIGYELPSHRLETADEATRLGVTPERLERRLGFRSLARKGAHQNASDLALAAVKDLVAQGVELGRVDCLSVVSQNPDGVGMPPLSAILHGKLGLTPEVAAFDLAHGCAGYVYGLAITRALMVSQGYRYALLITADPYSPIIDPDDYQTALIFGDAATATLLSDSPLWLIGHTDLGSAGAHRDALVRESGSHLKMNGRRIARICASTVPASIQKCLAQNELSLDEIDEVLLHQASRYLVESIGAALGAPGKTPFYAAEYGNTVSSSLPLALARHVPGSAKQLVRSGFGDGLSRQAPC